MRRAALGWIACGALLVGACGARTAIDVPFDVAFDVAGDDASAAPLDAATPPPDAAPDDVARPRDAEPRPPSATCVPPDAGAAGPACTRSVVVQTLTRSSPTCFVDVVVAVGQTGTLTLACAGDGEASIAFGSRSFAGAVVGGAIMVCTGTQFDWSDGCVWTSAQTVQGDVASGTLSFDYVEAPKPGQSSCAAPCTAHGTIAVR